MSGKNLFLLIGWLRCWMRPWHFVRLYWKRRRQEEGRRDEHLRQVILPRISCRQRFGVVRAWRVSIPTPFHFIPALGRGK